MVAGRRNTTFKGFVGLVLLAGALWFASGLGKTYPENLVDEWCDHAHELRTARLVDQAYAAYRRLHAAGGECNSARVLPAIRADLREREAALEEARAYRRAADLRGRVEAGDGRRLALQNAYESYLDGLNIDPFARGARQGFRKLIAAYRRIDPPVTDCFRATKAAEKGLIPEARILLSRSLRTGRGPCEAALADLRRRRVAAYQHLRVGQAREIAGNERAARVSFAAALREDASSELALAGVERVRPRPLKKEKDWQDDVAGFFPNVLEVAPKPILALLAVLLVLFGVLGVAWKLLVYGVDNSTRVNNLTERWTWLRRAREKHITVETPPNLEPPAAGLVEDTLARLRVPVIGTEVTDEFVAAGPNGVPLTAESSNGVGAQVDAAFAAVPSLALAAQLLRLGTTAFKRKADVGLVLEAASAKGTLEERWRIVDRKTGTTVRRVRITSAGLPAGTPDAMREEFFIIRAGEELRGAIRKALHEAGAAK